MLKSFLTSLNYIIKMLLPQNCIICKKYKDDLSLCNTCRDTLPRSKNIGVPWIYAYYNYEDKNIHKIIHSIKYYNKKSLIYDIVDHIYKYYLEKIDEYIRFQDLVERRVSLDIAGKDTHIVKNYIDKYILIPIPLSPDRQKIRGYNQSQLICEALLKSQEFISSQNNTENTIEKIDNLHKNHRSFLIQNLLTRDKNSIKLSHTKNKEDRIESLEGVFEFSAAVGRTEFKNSLYILIDDVTTTGATLYEARKTLVAQGISSDHIMAMALAH